ncbi:hypothetical protein [Coralloluteibacterium stylophorae]|uniref:Uncharacterized protein n=2 Tax=Coralloluteibacterium stylophorae TaxID=1776034 RepID=A0AAP2G047_9GAMM|nr:hypothetical protein [Coralloluteibacterium stylophorae]MBS7458879.1 hypothetical protein [Coralloluteibacterium stylophorae]
MRGPNEMVISERYLGSIVEVRLVHVGGGTPWGARVAVLDEAMRPLAAVDDELDYFPTLAAAVDAAMEVGRRRAEQRSIASRSLGGATGPVSP